MDTLFKKYPCNKCGPGKPMWAQKYINDRYKKEEKKK